MPNATFALGDSKRRSASAFHWAARYKIFKILSIRNVKAQSDACDPKHLQDMLQICIFINCGAWSDTSIWVRLCDIILLPFLLFIMLSDVVKDFFRKCKSWKISYCLLKLHLTDGTDLCWWFSFMKDGMRNLLITYVIQRWTKEKSQHAVLKRKNHHSGACYGCRVKLGKQHWNSCMLSSIW